MDVQQVSPCHDFSLAYWKLARLQTLVLFSRLNWNKNKRKAICNNNLYKNIKFKPEWDIIFVAGRVYMDTRYVYYRQLEYLHVSISSGSKCFSHVYTLPLSIWFWKFLSMTLVFVGSFSHSSRHFLYSAIRGEGSLKIPIPLVLRHVPQPNTEQLSPGILFSIRRTQKTIPVGRTTLRSFKNRSVHV